MSCNEKILNAPTSYIMPKYTHHIYSEITQISKLNKDVTKITISIIGPID